MIDIKKQYKTRDGHKVRVYAVDGGGKYPVHGAVFADGFWKINYWKEDGRWDSDSTIDDDFDLIEINPIEDKDPVYAWGYGYPYLRVSGFYDKINHCLFDIDGLRGGIAYSNYELIENPPQWMIEAQKTLKD